MAVRSTDRRDRFARNWKLIGFPSKAKWKSSLLNSRILSKTVTKLMDRFQSQTLPVIEQTSYEVGMEDSNHLKETLNIKENDARSCLEPIEMMCLLNGIDAEITAKKRTSASLKIKECPLNEVLVGIIPGIVVCRNYFSGMIHAVNENATIIQPDKKCDGDEYCEFVINIEL